MNKKIRIAIPAVIAVFAVSTVVAMPYVTADLERHGTPWHGKGAVMVEDFAGSIPVSDDANAVDLRDQITVSLAEAAQGRDVIKGGIGIVVNEDGQRFLVWRLISIAESTATIHIVDAGDVDNTLQVVKEFDRYDDEHRTEGGEKAMVNAMTGLIEAKLSIPTGDAEVDAARAQYIEMLQDVRQAYNDGDYKRVYELRHQMESLGEQIGDIDLD